MHPITRRFPDRRAFITGGGSGLGRCLAEMLAADGWTIGLTDVDGERLAETERTITERGGTPLSYAFDVTDRAAYEHAARDFLASTGGIDLLVNNAGVYSSGLFEDIPADDWTWLMDINLHGVVTGCRLFVPVFKQQEHGQIINISSAAGFSNAPGMAAYSASKAAVTSLSETLHVELAGHGVGVTVTETTFFQSNLWTTGRAADGWGDLSQKLIATGISTERVARAVLRAAARQRLRVIMPFSARLLRLAKRLVPGLFLAGSRRMLDRRDVLERRVEAAYRKRMTS